MSRPIVLITGGAGFIGSHTVECFLDHGYRVRVIDNLVNGQKENLAAALNGKNGTDLAFDERDIRDVAEYDSLFSEVQTVVHLAGLADIVPSVDRPWEYMSTNVMGTVRVLEGARRAGVKRFVYAASSSCYGLVEALPTSEDASISPMYPYALSKFQGEQAAMHWHRLYGLSVNSLRLFNVYGLRSRTTGAYGAMFGVFLKQKLEGKPFTVVGDGSQSRDFIYVSDVARAFFLASETKKTGQVYNIGAGKPQSVNRVVELLGGESISVPKRNGEPEVTWANIEKAKKELKWEPKISFEEGVQKMVEKIEAWRPAPLWDAGSIAEATRGWHSVMNGMSESE